MVKLISQIKEVLVNKGLSETKAAEMAGLSQKTVNNLLAGRTKRIDPITIGKLQTALGIVSERGVEYGTGTVLYVPTPEEVNLLKILENYPEVRETVETLVQLPERKRKIYLGDMLRDLEKLEEDKK